MSLRQYANAPATTLTSSVSNLATSIDVASIVGYPPTYPFILILDRSTGTEEVVLVTGGSGLTFTVTRGYDGTAAFSHASGATVEHGIAAIDPREANEHVNADNGVHGVTGNVVGDSDTQSLTNKDLSDGTNTFPPTLTTDADLAAHEADTSTHGVTGDVVGTTDTQTLTNKTLDSTSPTAFLPPGVFLPYGGSSASVPAGWLYCNGAAVSRTTYAALFAVLGENYGPGDGSTTFNLPDLRDRGVIGATGGNPRGTTGGSATKTITSANLPTHTHGAGTLDTNTTGSTHTHNLSATNIATGTATGTAPGRVARGNTTASADIPAIVNDTGSGNSGHTHGVTGSTSDGGFANDPLDVTNPFQAANYIIKI